VRKKRPLKDSHKSRAKRITQALHYRGKLADCFGDKKYFTQATISRGKGLRWCSAKQPVKKFQALLPYDVLKNK